MSGYTNRYIPLMFPDLGDRVSLLIRNPRLLPPGELSPDGVATDAEGQPLDPKAAEMATYEVMARLIVAWHVYDASAEAAAVDVDLDADDLDARLAALETADQTRLGPITAENVAKLPVAILKRLTEEVNAAADPH